MGIHLTKDQPEKKKVTAKVIKAALYWYFRFDRQWICADEATLCYGPCDMVVDTGADILEIEVKVTKNDLWGGEAKKSKHKKFYLNSEAPTKFYICVPSELIEEAEKWVQATNEKYGIIHFDSGHYGRGGYFARCITIKKTARQLHKLYANRHKKIAMRLCSIMAGIRAKEVGHE